MKSFDLIFCLIILPLMMLLFPVERWWGTYPFFFGSFVGWLYLTYFAYRYFIIPRLFHRGMQRALAVGAILLSLTVTLLFSSYRIASPFYHQNRYRIEAMNLPVWGARQNQQAVWLHYILVVTLCFAAGMLNEAYRQRMARREVEYERNKAELALYKAQINPHFLFNTLNTLYGLLITGSDKTEACMQRFINLTRYIYNNAHRETVTLSEEVEYLSQYIELQKLRLNEYADVRFDCEVEEGSLLMPPLVLVTFVENAFKYGISSSEPCFIHIALRQEEKNVRFEVENTICRHEDKEGDGTGIANCNRRLSLLYPDRYRLEYGRTSAGTFLVTLELNNTEVS